MRRWIGGLLIVAACAVTEEAARAAPSNQELAKERYAAGDAAMAAQDFETACKAFAESYALVQDGHTLVREALCFEAADKLASALTAWRVVRDSPSVADADKKESYAHVNDLEGRVGYVEVLDTARIDELGVDQIEVNGVATRFGVRVPTDAGSQVVVVRQEGSPDLVTRVNVYDGQTSTVRTGTAPNNGFAIAGWVSLGVGFVSGLGFILTAKAAIETHNEMSAACPVAGFSNTFSGCSADAPGIAARGEALNAGNLALGLLSVGGFIAGGSFLGAAYSVTRSRARLEAIAPIPIDGGAVVVARGVF